MTCLVEGGTPLHSLVYSNYCRNRCQSVKASNFVRDAVAWKRLCRGMGKWISELNQQVESWANAADAQDASGNSRETGRGRPRCAIYILRAHVMRKPRGPLAPRVLCLGAWAFYISKIELSARCPLIVLKRVGSYREKLAPMPRLNCYYRQIWREFGSCWDDGVQRCPDTDPLMTRVKLANQSEIYLLLACLRRYFPGRSILRRWRLSLHPLKPFTTSALVVSMASLSNAD